VRRQKEIVQPMGVALNGVGSMMFGGRLEVLGVDFLATSLCQKEECSGRPALEIFTSPIAKPFFRDNRPQRKF